MVSKLKLLSERELATVLAALRCWQRFDDADAMSGDERLALTAIASNEDEFDPLTDDEIDELCERLNAPAPMGHWQK